MGSMSKLKGTTLVAFFFEWYNGKEMVKGIILGADSRLSTKKRFVDIGKKIFPIGKNIRILMSGNGDDSEKMCAHLTEIQKNRVEGGPLKVVDVVDMVVEFLNSTLDKAGSDSNVGSIVAGYDDEGGLQVYRTKRKENMVYWEGEYNLVSVGSGMKDALNILEPNCPRKMSPETAAELGLVALYGATNNPHTGGTLHVIHVDNEGCHEMHQVDSMQVYSKYFNNMIFTSQSPTPPQNTLFLLCVEHVYADNLKQYLSLHGIIKAAPCIKKIGDLYFHRIVCDTADDVSAIYDFVRGSHHKPPLLEKNFPHGFFLETGVPVYIERSSEGLLSHLCSMDEKQLQSCGDDLEVYLKYYENYFSVNGYDQQTMIVISSEKLRGSELQSIKNRFSTPQGDEVIVARWLGKRGAYHFYRFFFRTTSVAANAYQIVTAVANAPPALTDIPFTKGMFVDPADPAKLVYVVMISKALLECICNFRRAVVNPDYKFIV